MTLSELETPDFTDAPKYLIAVTGVTTSGKSNLAKALSARLPDSILLPIMTTRMSRSNDGARFVSCVEENEFAATRDWVKWANMELSLRLLNFFFPTSKTAVYVCGPFEMVQLNAACPSNVKTLPVRYRRWLR